MIRAADQRPWRHTLPTNTHHPIPTNTHHRHRRNKDIVSSILVGLAQQATDKPLGCVSLLGVSLSLHAAVLAVLPRVRRRDSRQTNLRANVRQERLLSTSTISVGTRQQRGRPTVDDAIVTKSLCLGNTRQNFVIITSNYRAEDATTLRAPATQCLTKLFYSIRGCWPVFNSCVPTSAITAASWP